VDDDDEFIAFDLKNAGTYTNPVRHVVWRRYVFPLFYDPNATNDADFADMVSPIEIYVYGAKEIS